MFYLIVIGRLLCLQNAAYRRACPTQPLAVLPSVGQGSANALPQNLPLELGEDGQYRSHGPPAWCRQVQGVAQGKGTDSQVVQLLKRCKQVRHGSDFAAA